jgi:hypothetical protein
MTIPSEQTLAQLEKLFTKFGQLYVDENFNFQFKEGDVAHILHHRTLRSVKSITDLAEKLGWLVGWKKSQWRLTNTGRMEAYTCRRKKVSSDPNEPNLSKFSFKERVMNEFKRQSLFVCVDEVRYLRDNPILYSLLPEEVVQQINSPQKADYPTKFYTPDSRHYNKFKELQESKLNELTQLTEEFNGYEIEKQKLQEQNTPVAESQEKTSTSDQIKDQILPSTEINNNNLPKVAESQEKTNTSPVTKTFRRKPKSSTLASTQPQVLNTNPSVSTPIQTATGLPVAGGEAPSTVSVRDPDPDKLLNNNLYYIYKPSEEIYINNKLLIYISDPRSPDPDPDLNKLINNIYINPDPEKIALSDSCKAKNEIQNQILTHSGNEISKTQILNTPNQVNNTPNQVNNTPNQVNNTETQILNTPNQINNTEAQILNTPNQINNTEAQILNTPNQINKQTPENPELSERIKILQVASIYDSYLTKYTHNRHKFTPTKFLEPGQRKHAIFQRVIQNAESLSISFDTYMKAQFFYFDKWFSRPPKVQEIASYTSKNNALERAKAFLSESEFGLDRAVVGKVIPQPKVSQNKRFELSIRALQSIMKNYSASEEEVLARFAKGATAFSYFDKEWLYQNPTYQRLRESGVV